MTPELRGSRTFESANPQMVEIMREASAFARSDHSILITGETGTGKEVLADYIHACSLRSAHGFHKVNCAAIPETLFESELFGHEKGSFTGATVQKKGRFELAKGGTFMLDEIGELPFSLQAKLLRVLQDGSFYRVGGLDMIQADVRLLLTTNRDLSDSSQFRRDLYYRLSSFSLHLPPLRDRLDDIPGLAASMGAVLSASATSFLQSYAWPGNIREFVGVIRRAQHGVAAGEILHRSNFGFFAPLRTSGVEIDTDLSLKSLERRAILLALERSAYVQSRAAALLGITPRSLNYKIAQYGITHPTWRTNAVRRS